MRLLRTSTALRARVALRSRGVVLVDRFGELTAAELLDQVRLLGHRPGRAPHPGHARGLATLPSTASLRQVLVTALAGDGTLDLRSSGTTGDPRTLRRGALSPAQLTTLLDLARRIGLRPGRRVASLAPGVHGHGLLVALGALALGAPLIDLSHLPAPERVALLHRAPPALLTGVPVHLVDLLHADQEGAGNRPLRIPRIVSGSDLLAEPLQADLARHFHARVHDVYGTTETGPLAVDGRPLRGVRLRERDGLLRARTSFTRGRTLITDRGRIGPDGGIEVTGRADGAVSSGGMLHDPGAVAHLLRIQPGITAVQLRVVHDPRVGSRTIAEVTLAHAVTSNASPGPEELRALVRDRLGAASVPREVRISSPGR
ncbi:AMP-binding protein [Brachybacterium sacelli]|uniref:O-succinylbenzoic acid--CoA ligase n=1 Tax=Brachybacterium sacelli TaxID=173364 RepID=A0ABS4X1Q3_9MICO|nr:AMP-binding protein [Brachybacterium sacelli]MBP2382387.1 O-succinylbenzoic acid--CoA ligase [Brachybacterium sacelli]